MSFYCTIPQYRWHLLISLIYFHFFSHRIKHNRTLCIIESFLRAIYPYKGWIRLCLPCRIARRVYIFLQFILFNSLEHNILLQMIFKAIYKFLYRYHFYIERIEMFGHETIQTSLYRLYENGLLLLFSPLAICIR